MKITIYTKDGAERGVVSPDSSSTQTQEIEGDDVLALSFTTWEHLGLDVGDWCDYQGSRYWLMETYQPEMVSTMEWKYDVKLYGRQSLLKRFLVLETTDGDAEPVFALTAPAREHVRMVVDCVNAALGTEDWKVGEVAGEDNIVVDYEGTYCDEALKQVAEAVGGQAEWWVEGTTVNVSRCAHGETLEIGYRQGLTGLSRDTADTDKFYTRLFPIGSSRNIDAEKYGHSRLMLPGGRQYVEVKTEEYGIYDHYEKDAFAEIYPRRVGEVTEMTSKEAKNDDGTAYRIYYFKDDDLAFDPNDYLLSGETLRVSFVTGELAGLGEGDEGYFEVNYDSKAKQFEVITIWPYDDGTPLPGGTLTPDAGSKYILWNLRMPDEYVTAAEEELEKAVAAYNAEHWQDVAVYKGTTDRVWVEKNAVELFIGRKVKLVSEKYFPEEGWRETRITRLTRKVSDPGTVDLEMSDALQTGALQKVEDSVEALKTYTRERTSGLPDIIKTGDNTEPTDTNLYSARRTQKEFLSKTKADRTEFELGLGGGATFGEKGSGWGVDGQGNAILADVTTSRIHDAGSTEEDRVIAGAEGYDIYMGTDGKSHMYVDYLNVRNRAVFSALEIRKVSYSGGVLLLSQAGSTIARVDEIKSADGGAVVAYKCWATADDGTTATQNWWKAGMMALSQTFNVKAGHYANTGNRYWWRLVVDAGQETLEDGKLYDYFTVSNVEKFQGSATNILHTDTDEETGEKTAAWTSLAERMLTQDGYETDTDGTNITGRYFYGMDTDSDAPKAGDVAVQAGDQVRWTARGNVVKITTSAEDGAEENAPAMVMYHGMGAPYTTGVKDASGEETVSPYQWKTITRLDSPGKTYVNSDNFVWFSGSLDNTIEPIATWLSITPSESTIVRHADGTTTPEEITLSLRKYRGNATTVVTEGVEWSASWTDTDGAEHRDVELPNGVLTEAGSLSKMDGTVEVKAAYDGMEATVGIAVLRDGSGIEGIKTAYARSTQGTTPPEDAAAAEKALADGSVQLAWAGKILTLSVGSVWSDTIPELTDREPWLWTRTTYILADGTESEPVYSVSYKGGEGEGGYSLVLDSAASAVQCDAEGRLTDTVFVKTAARLYCGGQQVSLDNVTAGELAGNQPTYNIVRGVVNVGWTMEEGKLMVEGQYAATIKCRYGGQTYTAQYTLTPVKDGAQGEDAVSIAIEPLLLATDDKGEPQKADGTYYGEAAVTVRRGTETLTAGADYTLSVAEGDTENCGAWVSDDGTELRLAEIASYEQQDTDIDGTALETTTKVYYTDGYVDVTFVVDGVAYKARWSWHLDYTRYLGQVSHDNKMLKSTYSSLRTTTEGLRQDMSEVTQTAEEISATVSSAQQTPNLLRGTDFKRALDGWAWNQAEHPQQIRKSQSYMGRNSMLLKAVSGKYCGLKWTGLTLKKGTKYTMSFRYMAETVTEGLVAGSNLKDSGGTTLKGGTAALTAEGTQAGQWQTCSYAFEAAATYMGASLDLWVSGAEGELLVSSPILREGASTAWGLSAMEVGYTGGNLLDATDTLVSTSANNVSLVNGTLSDGTDDEGVYERTAKSNGARTYAMRWTPGFEAATEYMLSFEAKGEGTAVAWLEGTGMAGITMEPKDGEASTGTGASFSLGDEWQRYWLHWQVAADGTVPTHILIGCADGGTVTLRRPKLEEGATMTDWTTSKETTEWAATTEVRGGVKIHPDGTEVIGSLYSSEAGKKEKHLWEVKGDGSFQFGDGGLQWNAERRSLEMNGTFKGVLMREAVVITKDNWKDYISYDNKDPFGTTSDHYWIELEKVGSYVIFDSSLTDALGKGTIITVELPSLPAQTWDADWSWAEYAAYARTFVGCRIMAYNYSACIVSYGALLWNAQTKAVGEENGLKHIVLEDNDDTLNLGQNEFARFDCNTYLGLRTKSATELSTYSVEERVVWEYVTGTMSQEDSYARIVRGI